MPPTTRRSSQRRGGDLSDRFTFEAPAPGATSRESIYQDRHIWIYIEYSTPLLLPSWTQPELVSRPLLARPDRPRFDQPRLKPLGPAQISTGEVQAD